ncbi:MAG: PAS domain-containing protein [Verrucomicrobia bacterium]|nr:PAS domain-containing protein [Verrucomicrobiota bacterium]
METMTEEDLLKENAELRARLEEAEETLRAIRAGEVDAVMVGAQVFTLKSAETPYRILVEAMNEAAITLTPDGTVLYCNGRLAELFRVPHEAVVGATLRQFVAPADQPKFDALFAESLRCSSKGEIGLGRKGGPPVPVQLSLSLMKLDDGTRGLCAVITDLSERKRVEIALKQLTEDLEARVASRTLDLQAKNEELKKSNRMMVGRELRMIELKKEMNALCAKFGQPPKYPNAVE